MEYNIRLYPWLKFSQHMVFWQATWFLYFENQLSAAEAILLYAVYDLATTALEVPSGYMSDRLGRRLTMMLSAVFLVLATLLFVFGQGFWVFAIGNMALGASQAFNSGTDSSILYESLKAEGRESEVEAQEMLAWRFGFTALAISAFLGGAMAMYDSILPYVATALAAVIVLFLTYRLNEPPHAPAQNRRENLRQLRANLIQPTLLWILVLSILMYLFSHIPFVFGQPFIRETLVAAGFGAQTPLVSGTVSASMMVVSVAVSLIALPLRDRLGLPGILLLAFGIQVFLVAALATSNAIWVIGLLFLRMVPNSISQPFIQARVQPLLGDETRATYLSLQSFGGRLFFAATLAWAAGQSSGTDTLPYEQLQDILWAYCAMGVFAWIGLAATAKRSKVAPATEAIT